MYAVLRIQESIYMWGPKHTNGYCPTTVSIFEGMRRGAGPARVPGTFLPLQSCPTIDAFYSRPSVRADRCTSYLRFLFLALSDSAFSDSPETAAASAWNKTDSTWPYLTLTPESAVHLPQSGLGPLPSL